MSTGDAAALGRIFAHLHSKEQINSFLSAVQEIRQDRGQEVIMASAGNVLAVALPPGVAAAREGDSRAKAQRGLERLSGAGGAPQEEMAEMIEQVFAYDPEDEADDWWVEWGVMQERAQHWTIHDAVPLVEVVELEEAKVLTGSVLSFSVSTTVESVG